MTMKTLNRKMTCAVLSLVAAGTGAARAEAPKGDPAATVVPSAAIATTAATEKMQWWMEARFGMFIHFGLYSTIGRKEWVKTLEDMTDADYRKYFDNFDPDKLDARAWAQSAKRAGVKYAVLTAKHHEGFCLWDTKHTDYKSTKTPCGRDLVREFADAFRAEGIRVGFYYSLLDWHHPDYTPDRYYPGCFDGKPLDYAKLAEGRDMNRYRQYMKDQITELLTGYGRVDIMWYDFSLDTVPNFKSTKDWDGQGLLALTRRLQPWVIVDNRLGKDAPGDFLTPEQRLEPTWPTVNGQRVPWETCVTFSGSWGYNPEERTWKTPRQIVEMLARATSTGGNLILNVGPDGRGRFERRARERLEAVGAWMDLNGRAIYGCTQADGFRAPPNTLLTLNPKTRRLYLFILSWPTGNLPFAFADRVSYARFLHDASEVRIGKGKKTEGDGDEKPDVLRLPEVEPDTILPVVEMILK